MALSVVNFRMHHGNAVEQVTFSGNGIKLLDLKKEILDKKEINRSLDFDLKIVDENGKVYAEDDEVVPKNATIVVKRVPSKNSLIARLNSRGMYQQGGSGHAIKHLGEIVMPMKMEVEEPVAPPAAPVAPPVFATPASVAPTPTFAAPSFAPPPAAQSAPTPAFAAQAEDVDVFKLMMEEETTLKRTIPVTASWNAPTGGGMGMSGVPNHYGAHTQDPRYNKGGRGGAGANGFNKPSGGPNTYTCNRCQKTGHIAKYCPTIGDASFDPEIRLMNVPRTGRKTVSTLDGLDTSMSTVIQRNDGSYEVFESSARGMEKLTREGHLAGNMDMSVVPAHLKCALSNTLLREAVTLPCCNRSVNDSVVRLRLVSSGLTCPLCGSHGISPDSLIIRKDLRNEVENYIESLRRAEEPPSAPIPTFSTGFAVPPMSSPAFPAGFVPPIPSGPPPPQPLLPPPAASLALAGLIKLEDHTGPALLPVPGVVAPVASAAGMMSSLPGLGAMGGFLPPSFEEIPPLEALPLPLSRDQFLAEQRLQILLLKELHGGVMPQLGGYQGGRGNNGFNSGGRGGRGGYLGRNSHYGGGGQGRGGYQQQPYQERSDRGQDNNRNERGQENNRDDRYPRQGQSDDSRRDNRDNRDQERSNTGVDDSNKRRRDDDNYGSASQRSARPRSSERDAPPRPAPESRSERTDRTDRNAERDDRRERSSQRDRGSKRGDSRDRPQQGEKRPSRDEQRSAEAPSAPRSSRNDSAPPREEVRQESKRRRYEDETPRERNSGQQSSSNRGRSGEREPRESRSDPRPKDKDSRRDEESRSRSDRKSEHRSSGRSPERHSSAQNTSKTDTAPRTEADKNKRDSRDRQQSQRDRPKESREDRPREDRGIEERNRGSEKDRAPRESQREEKKVSRDRPEKSDKPRERGSSRDRGTERSSRDDKPREERSREDRSRDERPRDDRHRDDRSRGGGKATEKVERVEPEPQLILQEKDRNRDRTRDKGSAAPLSKIVTIPPLKSSRGEAGAAGGGEGQNHHSGRRRGGGGGGGGGGSSKRTVIASNESKRR